MMATHPDSPAISLLREKTFPEKFPALAQRKSTGLPHKPLAGKVFLHSIGPGCDFFREFSLLAGNLVQPARRGVASAYLPPIVWPQEFACGEWHEDPRWLYRHGRQHAADQIAARLRGDRL